MESDLLKNNLIFLLNIAGVLTAVGVSAGLYIWPRLRALPDSERLRLLLIPHTFRFVGLSFLLAGVSSEELVRSEFALPTAWGDFTAAVLALLCVVALTRRWSFAIPLVWTMNLWGTLDLLYANLNGRALDQTGPNAFGATYFIPTVWVPILFVSHYLMFIVLLRRLGAFRASAEKSASERPVVVVAGERDAEPNVGARSGQGVLGEHRQADDGLRGHDPAGRGVSRVDEHLRPCLMDAATENGKERDRKLHEAVEAVERLVR